MQVKVRNGAYISKDDIATFILRCEDKRFGDCKKILILKNCNISKKLRKKLADVEIIIM